MNTTKKVKRLSKMEVYGLTKAVDENRAAIDGKLTLKQTTELLVKQGVMFEFPQSALQQALRDLGIRLKTSRAIPGTSNPRDQWHKNRIMVLSIQEIAAELGYVLKHSEALNNIIRSQP